MKTTRTLVEDYFDRHDLNHDGILEEGWFGGLLGFIFGGAPGSVSASAGAVAGGAAAGPLGAFLGSAIGGAIGLAASTVLGHKIEEWVRYNSRVKLTGCKNKPAGRPRAQCVFNELTKIVKDLKQEQSKLKRGTPQWEVFEKKIERYEKDLNKLAVKVKTKMQKKK